MEALKAEIAAKRKALESDAPKDARPNKYMRRGDLERLKEEQARKEKEEKEAAAQAEAQRRAEQAAAKLKVSTRMHTREALFGLTYGWRTGPVTDC
jgi:pre-mRNA-splicing factor 18